MPNLVFSNRGHFIQNAWRQDAQTEFVLLRSCLSIPKVMFTLRTTDPSHHQDLWYRFDNMTRESMSRILGSPLNDLQWTQATLPVSKGGLGLRASSDHAPAAYIISLLSSQDLMERILGQECPPTVSISLLDSLTHRTGSDTTISSLQGVTQREVSLQIDLHNHQLLTNHITELGVSRDIARFASLSLPNAGAWLNALGLHLRPSEFIVSVKYRLGCDIFPSAGKCTACPHQSDKKGDHAISCGYEGERIARHDHLRNCLFTTCSQACLGPSREVKDLLQGSDGRPADLFIPSWTGGQDTALDVTVVNPLQVAMVHQAANTPGHALKKAFDRKIAKHGEPCRKAGVIFIPLPMETLGGWHEVTVKEVKKIGGALARHTGAEESITLSHIVQRLSVLLIKGNAALLLNRSPSSPPPNIDGIE